MARIRTIKPEFWDSPSTAKAGPWARLAFIAMWNWADDYGRGTANLKELEGFIFPNDNRFADIRGNTVTFRDIVAEVSECFGVLFYEVDGRGFYEIPSWERHQRNEKRAKQSRYPDPPRDATLTTQYAESAESVGKSATQEREVREVPALEQGNRGTGEQGNSSLSVTDDADASPDDRKSNYTPEFDSWWEHYPRKVQKGQAFKAFKAALKRTNLETLNDTLAAHRPSLAARDVQFIPYAATWLNGNPWDDEAPSAESDDDTEKPIYWRDEQPKIPEYLLDPNYGRPVA